jgi:hypothetical protein
VVCQLFQVSLTGFRSVGHVLIYKCMHNSHCVPQQGAHQQGPRTSWPSPARSCRSSRERLRFRSATQLRGNRRVAFSSPPRRRGRPNHRGRPQSQTVPRLSCVVPRRGKRECRRNAPLPTQQFLQMRAAAALKNCWTTFSSASPHHPSPSPHLCPDMADTPTKFCSEITNAQFAGAVRSICRGSSCGGICGQRPVPPGTQTEGPGVSSAANYPHFLDYQDYEEA